jgi:hypothetical protein
MHAPLFLSVFRVSLSSSCVVASTLPWHACHATSTSFMQSLLALAMLNQPDADCLTRRLRPLSTSSAMDTDSMPWCKSAPREKKPRAAEKAPKILTSRSFYQSWMCSCDLVTCAGTHIRKSNHGSLARQCVSEVLYPACMLRSYRMRPAPRYTLSVAT